MRNRSVILALTIAMTAGATDRAIGEAVDTAWVRFYDGPSALADNANDVDVDDNGYVYVTGSAQAPRGMFSPIHVLTMKFTPDGDTAWTRLLISPSGSNEQGHFIRCTSDGHAIVAANSNAIGLWIIKYTASGDTVWTRPTTLLGLPKDMEINANGDVWVIGETGTGDWRTLHYSADGTFQWQATFADIGASTDTPYDIVVDGADNAYVTGVGVWIGGNHDIVTAKYSSLGIENWRRRYNGFASMQDAGTDVMLDGDSIIFVSGTSERGPGDNDFVLIRYKPDGDTAWTRRFNSPGTGPDVLYDSDIDGAGNVYLSGEIYTSGSSSTSGTVKFNPSGDTAWARYWGPHLRVRDIVAEAGGDLYLAGEGSPPGAFYTDWGIMKYSPTGDSAWFRWLLNGLFPVGFQIPRAMELGPDGGLVTCGMTSSGVGGSNNVGVAKYVSPCSCPYQCDFNADTFLDSADLNELINVVFFNATDPHDPGCPASRADFNNDGVPDSSDLNLLISHLFFNGPPPTDPCA